MMRWYLALIGPAMSAGLLASSPPSGTPPLTMGAALYAQSCAYCHGLAGQGNVRLAAPRLWGPNNPIHQGAYGTIGPLARYIQHNMPPQPIHGVNPGSLTIQQARSLAAYILNGGRP
jgi:cytochrome c